MQFQFKNQSTEFLGIADDSGQTISFEYPVEIVDLNVIEGQEVGQGETLIKVRRNNLSSEQAILDEQINELNASHQSTTTSLRSEIKSLQARKVAEQANLDVSIQKLQAQYQTNKELLVSITGSSISENDSMTTIAKQVAELKKQRVHLGKSLQAQIDNLNTQLANKDKPIFSKISALKERRSELDRQVTELQVKADLTGRVGNILYKAGETIDAFQSILTIHALRPEFVKGYVNENVYNQVLAGQQVWLYPVAKNGELVPVKGTVENIGNRIVEYPLRLRKHIHLSAWGREVLIKLENKNVLLLGEKVSIQLSPPSADVFQKFASYVMQE